MVIRRLLSRVFGYRRPGNAWHYIFFHPAAPLSVLDGIGLNVVDRACTHQGLLGAIKVAWARNEDARLELRHLASRCRGIGCMTRFAEATGVDDELWQSLGTLPHETLGHSEGHVQTSVWHVLALVPIPQFVFDGLDLHRLEKVTDSDGNILIGRITNPTKAEIVQLDNWCDRMRNLGCLPRAGWAEAWTDEVWRYRSENRTIEPQAGAVGRYDIRATDFICAGPLLAEATGIVLSVDDLRVATSAIEQAKVIPDSVDYAGYRLHLCLDVLAHLPTFEDFAKKALRLLPPAPAV